MCCEHTATQATVLGYKTLLQNSLMTTPFKGPMQNEPKPEIGISQEMEASPHGNLCVVLCSATKTTANITKMTDDDWARGGVENKEICSYNYVSNLAYSACVEQLHLFTNSANTFSSSFS